MTMNPAPAAPAIEGEEMHEDDFERAVQRSISDHPNITEALRKAGAAESEVAQLRSDLQAARDERDGYKAKVECPIGIPAEHHEVCSAGTCYTCIASRCVWSQEQIAEAAESTASQLSARVRAALDDACRMSAILLMAGEMTAQERRTAQAVAHGLAAKVRSALDYSETEKRDV